MPPQTAVSCEYQQPVMPIITTSITQKPELSSLRCMVASIPDDSIEHILSFLTPKDMLIAMQVNTYWKQLCAQDHIWHRFCTLRWNVIVTKDTNKACGTADYRELYCFFHRNRILPGGKYTLKHQLIWGTSRQEGVDVWMTIAHRPDCRLVRYHTGSYIQLRLVIQNLQSQPLSVDMLHATVRFKSGRTTRVMQNTVETHLSPRVVALNGLEQDSILSDQSLTLNTFEFAVVVVNVECEECEFESDFLERCRALWLPVRRRGACRLLSSCRCGLTPDNYHHGSIHVPIVDESVIWKHYEFISGQFMVLNTSNSSSKAHSSLVGRTPKLHLLPKVHHNKSISYIG